MLKENFKMMKLDKLKVTVMLVIMVVSVFAANLSCYASWPFRIYQEKMPESLLKKQEKDS
jgi:hypothetical protein